MSLAVSCAIPQNFEPAVLDRIIAAIDEPGFATNFVANPREAIGNSTIGFSFEDLVNVLSSDSEAMDQFVTQMSKKVDIQRIAEACNTCCS